MWSQHVLSQHRCPPTSKWAAADAHGAIIWQSALSLTAMTHPGINLLIITLIDLLCTVWVATVAPQPERWKTVAGLISLAQSAEALLPSNFLQLLVEKLYALSLEVCVIPPACCGSAPRVSSSQSGRDCLWEAYPNQLGSFSAHEAAPLSVLSSPLFQATVQQQRWKCGVKYTQSHIPGVMDMCRLSCTLVRACF